jgi:hypothetical protein
MTEQAQPNLAQQQRFNSAQISTLEKKLRESVQAIVKDVSLRQWAVEQALTHCARHNEFKDIQPIFEGIYKFVAQATEDIKVVVS